METLLTIHSIVRWLATLTALALIVRLVIGLVKKQPFDKLATGLTSAFGGLMDTQLLLGLLFFIWSGMAQGGFSLRYRWEHLVAMLVAVLVAHLPVLWKKLDDEKRYRNTLAAVIFALLLVFLGVALLPGNRWAELF
jgi:hypothetical protein